jgi:YHS domain-containing protein
MTLILLWILRVIVVLFVLRLLLRALFPRGIGAPADPRRARSGRHARPGRTERIGGELVRDPQCGTYVPKARAVVAGSGAKALYFCSTTCRDTYLSANASGRKASA